MFVKSFLTERLVVAMVTKEMFSGSFYISNIIVLLIYITTDIVFLKHNSTVFPSMLAATSGGKDLGVVSVKIRQRLSLSFFIVSHFFSLWFPVFDNTPLTCVISHSVQSAKRAKRV